MNNQDDNNQESLNGPEISPVTERAKLRRLTVIRSADHIKKAFSLMDPAHKGEIHKTVSAWAKRPDWSVKSDFLSPIVHSVHTKSDLESLSKVKIDGTLKLDEVISESENALYVDSLTRQEDSAMPGFDSIEIDAIRDRIGEIYDGSSGRAA